MNGLAITDVQVRPYERADERLKAFATITLNNCFVVTDLKVIDSPKGLFVAMPSRKKRDGRFRDIAHPLNQACRDEIESRVLEAYKAAAARGGAAALDIHAHSESDGGHGEYDDDPTPQAGYG